MTNEINELKSELVDVNKKIAEIVFSVTRKKQGLPEKILWLRKRKILAKLNSINS